MLPFIDKVTIRTYILALFIWNAAPNFDVADSAGVGGRAAGLAAIAVVLNSSDVIQFPDHGKSRIKLYFTVTQRQMARSSNNTQIF